VASNDMYNVGVGPKTARATSRIKEQTAPPRSPVACLQSETWRASAFAWSQKTNPSSFCDVWKER